MGFSQLLFSPVDALPSFPTCALLQVTCWTILISFWHRHEYAVQLRELSLSKYEIKRMKPLKKVIQDNSFSIYVALFISNFWLINFLGLLSIDHFKAVCLVAWPLNESEDGVDLVLIETSLLFLWLFLLISMRTHYYGRMRSSVSFADNDS